MSILVWFTLGVALRHFTVFVPDRFWGGIVGAFIGSAAGAMVSGAIAQIALGKSVGDTDLATALYAVPGCVIGLAIVTRSACARASRPSTSRRPRRPNTGHQGAKYGDGDSWRYATRTRQPTADVQSLESPGANTASSH
jgi:hypothetical protein